MNRSEVIRDKAIEMLKENDDLFAEVLEIMDSNNGYLGGDTCYPMDDIDEHLRGKTPRKILDAVDDDFNLNNAYFYYNGYGYIESTNDKSGFYRSTYDEDDVFDDFINARGKYVSCSDGDFTALCDMYDEYEGCDSKEYDEIETEDEFLERLENL